MHSNIALESGLADPYPGGYCTAAGLKDPKIVSLTLRSLKFKLNQTTKRQKLKAKNNPINWRQLFRDDWIKELFTKTVDKKLKELK